MSFIAVDIQKSIFGGPITNEAFHLSVIGASQQLPDTDKLIQEELTGVEMHSITPVPNSPSKG